MNFRLYIPLFMLIISLSACENNERDVQQLLNKQAGVEVADSVTIHYTSNGKIKAILTAPLMLRTQDTINLIEFPNTLFVLFFNESGEPESKLSAQYGNYAELKEIVHLKDSVRVINFVKEDTLFTDELMWDRRRTGREFYTDKTVKIRTPTRQLDGIGMEADQNFKSYHIIEVTGILDLPSSSLPVN